MKSIEDFTSQKNIAIAGVSGNKHKFGNTVYKELHKKGYNVFPINPNLDDYNGKKCYHTIDSLPNEVTAIVINTKDKITKKLINDAITKGIQNIWLQQGCASKETLNDINQNTANIISKQCILMFAGEVKGFHAFHRWLNKKFTKFPS